MPRFSSYKEEQSANIEKMFRIKYGSYPERFYFNKISEGLSSHDASAEVQKRIDDVWNEMKFNFNRTISAISN